MFRPIVGISMGTNSAHFIADFLYCYESQYMAKIHAYHSKNSLISLLNCNCWHLDAILNANIRMFIRLHVEKC